MRDLGLADAGGAGEQVAADRLLRLAQAGAGELDRRGQRLDRLVLAEHDALQVLVDGAQHLGVGLGDGLGRDARHGGDGGLHLLDADLLLALPSGTSICEAPVSSITSMALSGSLRSWMYLADSSTAALMASLVYLSLW